MVGSFVFLHSQISKGGQHAGEVKSNSVLEKKTMIALDKIMKKEGRC